MQNTLQSTFFILSELHTEIFPFEILLYLFHLLFFFPCLRLIARKEMQFLFIFHSEREVVDVYSREY
jgi:hypothetical protein